eukprot:CAMPEP_0202873660 /NCGR_PEP_ID=MMETSP1391-20130828/23694_1 /ASSEMBLY_ACC=CAM_ASM_000867 /TAXON_ID=1034604 /ORGANISM="Chlamydomonas leiostraca, Strain SAG 11-49" /LENGTH=110 /DNA_ID=CAMNT_0049554915 /DNA_START=90 /DNA_END=419 /DNA_ORIENTATION=+
MRHTGACSWGILGPLLLGALLALSAVAYIGLKPTAVGSNTKPWAAAAAASHAHRVSLCAAVRRAQICAHRATMEEFKHHPHSSAPNSSIPGPSTSNPHGTATTRAANNAA